jgi:FimV-like protein
MRKFIGACLVIGFVMSSPAMAESYSFTETPPEQSLVRPGEEPKQQPVKQQSVKQQSVQQPQRAQQPARQVQQQQPAAQDDNAFYLRPTYVSQEDFNIFKRQVVQVLKDGQTKTNSLTQQLLDMKIQVQRVGPQMNSLKQMMLQMSKLLPTPGQQNPAAATVWRQWWFWLLVAWSALLTLIALWLTLVSRRKSLVDVGPDNGGDYDFMSNAESLPAHLELAQTYITMNDYKHARRSLEFVIMQDNAELKQHAMKLLKQLPKG